VGIAQNKIDNTEFGHLVDYANCQYLMAFIEKYDAGKPYIKDTYEKSVKPELQKAKLSDLENVPNFEKIEGLFQNNSNNTALLLAKKINYRKTKYDNYPDNDALIKSLYTEKWESVDLTSTTTKVQNEIRKKYNLGVVSQQKILNDKTIENSGKVEELQEKNQTLQQRVESLEQQIKELENKQLENKQLEDEELESLNSKVWIALILTLLVFIVLFFIFRKKNSQLTEPDREQIITAVLESQRIAGKFISRELYKSPPNIKPIEEKIAILENQVKKLQEKGNSDGRKNNTEEKVISLQNKTDDVKFFKSKRSKILTEELQDSTDALFRVFNIKGDEAEFEYCGGVINQDFLTDVCIFTNNPSDVPNKTKITTTSSGIVKKDSNNNWEVTEKAKIKFG
jgi:uncharacterized protein YlxW (UPF0749 family)